MAKKSGVYTTSESLLRMVLDVGDGYRRLYESVRVGVVSSTCRSKEAMGLAPAQVVKVIVSVPSDLAVT